MTRLLHIVRKEFLELRQDPRLFGIVIMAPIVQLTMLGYAATTDVRDVPVVVVDEDRSVASRELVSRFDASANFSVVAAYPSIVSCTIGAMMTMLNRRGSRRSSRNSLRTMCSRRVIVTPTACAGAATPARG